MVAAAQPAAAPPAPARRAAAAPPPRAAAAPGPRAATAPSPARPRAWDRVESWIYQLQHLDLPALEAADADLVVIDYSKTGAADAALTRAEVRRLQDSGKLVVSYLSIGEAEPYRFYWRKGWGPGNPKWLLEPNPNWPDNYPVLYWAPYWKNVMRGHPQSYLDRILAAGFDGVYLDIVDGYEALMKTYPDADQKMKDLVAELATYARARAGADFGVFPQNALDLLEDERYRGVITGLGKEETYYFPGDQPNPKEDRIWEENELQKLVDEGKLVITVDYCRAPRLRAWVQQRARARGFVPYLADVDLDKIEPQP